MMRSFCVALVASLALVTCDAFISPQARWAPASMTARQQGSRSLAKPITIRSMPTTARKAAVSDDDAAAETATPESPSASVPEDLDYYSGLLGQQPGADKAATKGKEKSASTGDYPIPLPSYLLLAMATVLSIAFTGSIFEVTGGHPEV
ncbi:unnamed protein product, partial [Hapterophycus canaliculatus]